MIYKNLNERPLTFFHIGEKVRLVDNRGTAGYIKRNGFWNGQEFTITSCWEKKGGRKNRRKILCTLSEVDGIFSTRRFDRINHFDERLFEL